MALSAEEYLALITPTDADAAPTPAQTETTESVQAEDIILDSPDNNSTAGVPEAKPTVKMPVPTTFDSDYDLPPQELASLVYSGDCFYSNYTNGRPNHWVVKRCSVCHNFFKDECCQKPTVWVAAEDDGKLTKAGRQAAGLEPIEPPKTSEQKEQERITSWKDQSFWGYFRGADELSGSGKVEFLIDGFLMKGGVTFFGGSPEGGKSLVAMSIAKALTTGEALFGKLQVVEPCPVLWLAAEGGDNGLKIRLRNFRITSDKNRFICRTLSQGAMLRLDDPHIKELVEWMHPVVILETAVRFGEGNEDSASDTNLLAGSIFSLISYGARAVVAIHHATKNLKQAGTSLQTILRGSSDFGALADVVIAVNRDERLYQYGTGPNEIDLISCKGRDFTPAPIRLAVTGRAPEGTPLTAMWKPGLISHIDQDGDLKWINKGAAAGQTLQERLDRLIQDDPTITLTRLIEQTGGHEWEVRTAIKNQGWSKPAGRAKRGEPNRWTKIVSIEKSEREAANAG